MCLGRGYPGLCQTSKRGEAVRHPFPSRLAASVFRASGRALLCRAPWPHLKWICRWNAGKVPRKLIRAQRHHQSSTAPFCQTHKRKRLSIHLWSGSDRHLEFFGNAEGDLFAGLDLDWSTCRRITAHAGSAVPHLQTPESGDPHSLAAWWQDP